MHNDPLCAEWDALEANITRIDGWYFTERLAAFSKVVAVMGSRAVDVFLNQSLCRVLCVSTATY